MSFWNIRPYKCDEECYDFADWFSIFFRSYTPSKEVWRNSSSSSDIKDIFRGFDDDIEWQIQKGVLFIEQQLEYTLYSNTPNKLPRKYKKPKGGKRRKARQLPYDYPVTNAGPNSVAQAKEFGNIRSFPSDGDDYHNNSIEFSSKREDPLVDIITSGRQVKIVVEMPLINKKDIKVKAYNGYVELSAASTQRGKYHRIIDIPLNIDLRSGKSTYRNGILEIVFSKRKNPFIKTE
jgi:HSP20 family protein